MRGPALPAGTGRLLTLCRAARKVSPGPLVPTARGNTARGAARTVLYGMFDAPMLHGHRMATLAMCGWLRALTSLTHPTAAAALRVLCFGAQAEALHHALVAADGQSAALQRQLAAAQRDVHLLGGSMQGQLSQAQGAVVQVRCGGVCTRGGGAVEGAEGCGGVRKPAGDSWFGCGRGPQVRHRGRCRQGGPGGGGRASGHLEPTALLPGRCHGA